jgi:hypothetical protein
MARASATKISVTALCTMCMGSAFVVQVDASLPEQRISEAPERPDHWPDSPRLNQPTPHSPPADRDQDADRPMGDGLLPVIIIIAGKLQRSPPRKGCASWSCFR